MIVVETRRIDSYYYKTPKNGWNFFVERLTFGRSCSSGGWNGWRCCKPAV